MLSLDEETFKLAEKIFTEGKFSEWVRVKIIEEHHKENSPEVLRQRILEVTREIEDLNGKRNILQKQLELKIQEEDSKAQKLLEQQQDEIKIAEKIIEQIMGKVGLILQYKMKVKNVNREMAVYYAKKYLTLKENERPDLESFLQEAIKNVN